MSTKTTKEKPINRISTTNGKAKAKPKKAKEEVVLEMPKMEVVKFTIVGTSELICKQFSLKGPGQAIIDKAAKQSPKAKKAIIPEEEFKDSLYMMPGSKPAGEKGAKYGFPASGLKKSMMTAAGRFLYPSNKQMNSKVVAGAVFVLPSGPGSDLMQIKHAAKYPHMRSDPGRNPNTGGAVMIHRGGFGEWSIDVLVRYNAAVLSREQLFTIVQWAGAAVGLGEWRAEKGGVYGCFEIKM